MSPYPLAPSWVDFYEIRAERDAANARADQAIRFAEQVEEECARKDEALEKIRRHAEDPTVPGELACTWVEHIARAALTPITHDLPSDTETGS